MRDRLARQEFATALGFGAFLLTGVGMALWVVVESYSPVPSQDFWGELPFVARALDGHVSLGDLWAQDNEHRIFMSRLAFLVEYGLFDGRYIFLLTVVLLSCLLVAVSLAAIVWRGTRNTRLAWAFGCVAGMAILSPVAAETFTFAFNVGYVQVYVWATVAVGLVVAAARTERSARRRYVLVGLAAVAAIAATCSLSSGLLLWPVLVALAVALRLGLRGTATVVVVGTLTAASYLWQYERVSTHSDYETSIKRPVSVLKYVAVYLGSPVRPAGVYAAGFVGLIGIALLALLLMLAWRSREGRSITTPSGAALGLFIFLSATVTAIGRLGFGLTQAMSSRYATPAAVFWLGLLLGFLQPAAERVRVSIAIGDVPRRVGVFASLGLAALALLFVSLAALPDRTSLRAGVVGKELAVLAHRVGVHDPVAVAAVFPAGAAPVRSGIRWLEAERLGPWAPGGMVDDARVELSGLVGNTVPCRGRLDSIEQLEGGARLTGWIAAPGNEPTSRELVVVTKTGTRQSIGLVGTYRPDVHAAGAASSDWTGFVAYTRGQKPSGIVLVRSNRRTPACRLGLG